MRSGLGIIVRRSAAYLNWRFVAKPENSYQRKAAVAAGRSLIEYVVYRVVDGDEGPSVRILDLLVDFDAQGALEQLVAEALHTAREVEATHVVAAASKPELARRLGRIGFLRKPHDEYYMVENYLAALSREQVCDIRHWYLTLSDADGDCWN